MKKDDLGARKMKSALGKVKGGGYSVTRTSSGYTLTSKDGFKIATKGGSAFTMKEAAKAQAKVVKGHLHLAGHRVAGIMPDGTPILEPVSKPSSFTRKEIKDTVREVRSKSKEARA